MWGLHLLLSKIEFLMTARWCDQSSIIKLAAKLKLSLYTDLQVFHLVFMLGGREKDMITWPLCGVSPRLYLVAGLSSLLGT